MTLKETYISIVNKPKYRHCFNEIKQTNQQRFLKLC